MTTSGFDTVVTDTSIIHVTPEARGHLEPWFQIVSTDDTLADHIASLGYVLRGTAYDQSGRLMHVERPHVGRGTHERANVPPECIVRFLGHDLVLQLNPFLDGTKLRRIDIFSKEDELKVTFDPPAPPISKRKAPPHMDWADWENRSGKGQS